MTARASLSLAQYYRGQADNFMRAAKRVGQDSRLGRELMDRANFMRDRARLMLAR